MGDISDVTKLAGFEFTKHVKYSDEGEIIALRGLNVKNGDLVLDDVKYIDESDFSKLNRSKLIKDDILFTYVGTVGQLALVPENDKFYLAPNVARVRVNNGINPMFLGQQMSSSVFYSKVVFPLIATSSQPALSMENIRKFQVFISAKDEQDKVASFFKQLDEVITLHQRKLKQLQVLKQAYLQQMFPSDTEKVPKLRFANFNKEWELCQLSSRVENIGTGNSTFTSNTPKSCENPFGVLGSTSVISYDSHFDYSGDFILTARVGANAGELYTHSGSIKISDNTVYIQASNLKFVFYLLINYDLKRLSYGTGQPLVKTSELKKLKMNFPSKSSEENKIGLFLATLENTIALHQHKLEQMQNLKQAYLQKMFI